ncbi:MAG: hypothetical protein CME84_00555 [Henriciella sp.]|jgi:hypothetical protein|uniref:hypothetical protein n=1 Tax=Henriciella sp. TaxID=1968823 RepID=UPI000C108C7E|nr:hypothetical protein [Henriciella sp.]MAN72566.1 hypothetical protein [Henriciella sp.]MBF33104.1 hypothetical protein [Hyphomonadaceae bacterium]PHR82988.1 MAG: hypothetical protein COA64_00965 [Henriciella sp.]|tara:strand:+ start:30715 stop:31614 length:900 start_codon:yes stop_codon:yes gene_type:complete
MIRGLPASILLHAAVIGAGYIVWPYVGTTETEEEFVLVPVELVEVGEMTNVAPVVEPEEPEPVEEEPEPEPEPEPEEEDVPVEEVPDERDIPVDDVETSQEAPAPEAEDDILPNFEAEPDEEEEAPPEEPEEERPATPNPQRKSSALDDLLNSAESTFQSERETRRETRPPPREPEPKREEAPAPQERRSGAGERTANTVRIEQLLYNQIYPCWDGVSDQPEPERLNVSMRARLDAEGNVIDLDLVRPSRAPIGDRSMQLAIERAQRAVQKCQPYRLPRDDYDLWKEATINLGPAFTGN